MPYVNFMKQPRKRAPKRVQNTRITRSARATERLGASLAETLVPGMLILLEGPIGAGKTTFVKGLAKGLGITAPVTSPTFVLHKQYALPETLRGIQTLHHIDAYRLHSTEDLRDTIEEYMESSQNGLWLVEWGSQIKEALMQADTVVTFQNKGLNARQISIARNLSLR